MLKILFSPSEGKITGGEEREEKLFGAPHARDEILSTYRDIILSSNEESIKALFGFKKFSECTPYIVDIFNSPLMHAIERYDGVAYDYLQYKEQDTLTQAYLREHTLIFSNLYGPILGGDTIANYKVKQGNSIGDIAPDKFYKECFSYQLDLYLGEHDILDLRAGYYDKFYKANKPFTTLKFLKNGKTVSHWAKAYRGIVLREVAKNKIESLDEFMKLEIENLLVHEIKQTKNKTEIVYNIVE
ncbi:YaaA family protein [Sulfurimonas paralvinellae]|uniref:YaaA family protein n=1 Tax=Sulfurimonas paralvinellae TaxID=317658 RepID=A0A7M1B5J5_9BACT|nr:peroxide stress protein YaaA [Sulfurimonas paralvinellae]QOP44994.1 YaaA family protein [Sulfurimonas paralvinellae]